MLTKDYKAKYIFILSLLTLPTNAAWIDVQTQETSEYHVKKTICVDFAKEKPRNSYKQISLKKLKDHLISLSCEIDSTMERKKKIGLVGICFNHIKTNEQLKLIESIIETYNDPYLRWTFNDIFLDLCCDHSASDLIQERACEITNEYYKKTQENISNQRLSGIFSRSSSTSSDNSQTYWAKVFEGGMPDPGASSESDFNSDDIDDW